MDTNPFEDENGSYQVLVNDDGQHSLWPAGIDVPAGWQVALQAAPRASCLAYIETHWTDMRPASLVRD
ncbi:MbtH family protein [Nonomuraea purpurea]|uniref:MbtH family protein n=1 Tax=Nonomuraea purpurea TaxID=1849276 RepID=A0ABV8G6M3_9ACTN